MAATRPAAGLWMTTSLDFKLILRVLSPFRASNEVLRGLKASRLQAFGSLFGRSNRVRRDRKPAASATVASLGAGSL